MNLPKTRLLGKFGSILMQALGWRRMPIFAARIHRAGSAAGLDTEGFRTFAGRARLDEAHSMSDKCHTGLLATTSISRVVC